MDSSKNGSLNLTPLDLVAFRLDQQTYALPIEPIIQIIEMVTLTPLPQLDPLIDGVINFHGTLLPVISLRRYLGLPTIPLHLHTPIILVRHEQQTFGLIVDQVLDVIRIAERHLTRPDSLLPKGIEKPPLLSGLARLPNNQLLLLINLTALFTSTPLCALLNEVPSLAEINSSPISNLPAASPLPNGETEKDESTLENQS